MSTSGTVQVTRWTQLVFLAGARNPGGVSDLHLQIRIPNENHTAYDVDLRGTPDANGNVPDELSIFGSNGAGGEGRQALQVLVSSEVDVSVNASNFNNQPSSIAVTYVPVDTMPSSSGPVDLMGVYWAFNVGTQIQAVTLTVSGTLESSQGTGGRTSFNGETAQGQLPPGTGTAPGTLGHFGFTVTNLQRGTWRVTVQSNVAGPVTCEVSLPSISNFNASGSGNSCQAPGP